MTTEMKTLDLRIAGFVTSITELVRAKTVPTPAWPYLVYPKTVRMKSVLLEWKRLSTAVVVNRPQINVSIIIIDEWLYHRLLYIYIPISKFFGRLTFHVFHFGYRCKICIPNSNDKWTREGLFRRGSSIVTVELYTVVGCKRGLR